MGKSTVFTICLFLVQLSTALTIPETIKDLRACVTIPEICPNENITFWLYNSKTKNEPFQLDMDDLEVMKKAPFLKNSPVEILIHGYTGHRDYSPNTEIRPELLKKARMNVISLDYGRIVKEPCYINAVQNVKVVGNCTAQLIDHLIQEKGLSLENIHVIGFSLGGQVAGNIANFLKSGTLTHITGLDPALPLFTTLNNKDKLDKSDADFVDVIHTNAIVNGKLEPSGNVDFYVNGGSIQPGCGNAEDFNSCNHARAPAYYGESINTTKGFYGTKLSYLACVGNINNCAIELMGYYVSRDANGIYYVKTNSEPPYALGKEGLNAD